VAGRTGENPPNLPSQASAQLTSTQRYETAGRRNAEPVPPCRFFAGDSVSAGIAVGAQINHSGVLLGTHPAPRAVTPRERVGVLGGARMVSIDSQWGATVGARVEARAGPAAESVAVAGCGPRQPRPSDDHRNRLLRDRLASGWMIQLGWCIVPVSRPGFLNDRLLDSTERQIMSGITLDLLWRGPRLAVRAV
jgi:hypothetical protein